MVTDFSYLLVWFAMLAGLWIGAFPLLWSCCKKLPDGGFGVGIPFASGVSAWIVWMLASLQLMPFSLLSSIFSLIIVFSASSYMVYTQRLHCKAWLKEHWRIVSFELGLYVLALVAWSIVRGYQPDIQGLEKFMDAGFVNSILRSSWMPPHDPWFSPLSINYYYFGHFIAAFLTLLSGIDSAVTYNLLLATVFASSMVGGMSVVYNFVGGGRQGLVSGIFAAILLNFGGNLHTAWHFLSRQEKSYWYPDATRFIQYTIHEFPAYSHVVADLHGHVMDVPVVLLFFVLLIAYINSKHEVRNSKHSNFLFPIMFGFFLGIMSMTNTWDVPIYGLIFALLCALSIWTERPWQWTRFCIEMCLLFCIAGLAFFATSLPFHLQFHNFAKGIALVEARSPIWQLGILWGGFAVIGAIAIWQFWFQKRQDAGRTDNLPLVMIAVSALLIVIPEILYVKDIYIKEYHRANTMFKLTYQSFVMMCLVFGMTLGYFVEKIRNSKFEIRNYCAIILLLTVFAAHMAYPFFSIKSYYGLTTYRGLYGLRWFSNSYPDDRALLLWMQKNIQGAPVILEAVGESYTDYARFSTFSGLPTILGWRVHEWLWRGSFDEPQKRTEEVKTMYETPLLAKTNGLFQKYAVRFVMIGALERKSYTVSEQELLALGIIVFRSGDSSILELK